MSATTQTTPATNADAYYKDRLFAYDNTLRTAMTREEVEEATRLIDNIASFSSLKYYTSEHGRFLTNSASPFKMRYFGTQMEHWDAMDEEEWRLEKTKDDMRAAMKKLQDAIDDADTALGYVGEEKARIERKLEEEMEEVKEALKEEQRSLREEDEERLKKKRMRKGDETPVRRPWKPTPHTTDPGPLTLSSRKEKKCYRCHQVGHLAKDHDKRKKTSDNGWSTRAQYRGEDGNRWWTRRVKEEYEDQQAAFENAPWGDE